MIMKTKLDKIFENSYEEKIYKLQEKLPDSEEVISVKEGIMYVLDKSDGNVYYYNYKTANDGGYELSKKELEPDVNIASISELREEIKKDYMAGKVDTDKVIYLYKNIVSGKSLVESLDRELVWTKEYKKNKNKIISSLPSQKRDVNSDTGSGSEVLVTNEGGKNVVSDFKKLHEKVKKIMDDILSIYALYNGNELKEDIDLAVMYSRVILEDIERDAMHIKNCLDFVDKISYDDYVMLNNRLNDMKIFVEFIKN